MAKIDVIHLVPNLFPYGAYAALEEMYYAFNKYHSDEVACHIMTLKENEHFGMFRIPYQVTNMDRLKSDIRKKFNNPIVFMHKLGATDCKPVSQEIHGEIPFVIINHTQTGRCRGLSRSDAIVTVSKHMHDSVCDIFRKFNFKLIRNGIDPERYEKVEPRKPAQVEGYFVTGRLNNFNVCKHSNAWIPKILETKLDQKHWHDYVGGGHMFKTARKQLSKVAQKSDSDNICNLVNRINDFEKKAAFIRRWNIFLYHIPGVEGISMSLLEALACGVPVIINNKPGNNEVIEKGINGFVCKNEDKMLAAVNRLINDKDRYNELRQSTKQHFKDNFHIKYTVKNYIDLSIEVLDGFK